MADESVVITPEAYAYFSKVSFRETDTLKKLREATSKFPGGSMMTAPEQGQFLHFLCGLIGAKRVIEVGTFTGYGTLWMASALPEDGKMITCEYQPHATEVGKPFWKEAGVDQRIELRVGLAKDTLQALLDEGDAETFDLIYIDADKASYDTYYELALKLIRPGGVIAIDNVLYFDRYVHVDDGTPATAAVRALNKKIHEDDRVEMSMLPIGGGMTLVKRTVES